MHARLESKQSMSASLLNSSQPDGYLFGNLRPLDARFEDPHGAPTRPRL
jgi:hypothetical protein